MPSLSVLKTSPTIRTVTWVPSTSTMTVSPIPVPVAVRNGVGATISPGAVNHRPSVIS